jgi:gliding motility-associated-like protein
VPVLCQYDVAAPLSATGSSLTWYSPGGGVSTTAPTPSTATPGVDTYYVTQTVSGCVSDRAALIFTVTAKPNPPVVRDTTYCQYASSAALTAVGSNLKWYTVAVGGTALASVPVPSTNTVGTTTWYVSQTVNSCESDRAPIAVTILYLPDFDIRASRNFACQFDTLSLYYNGPSMTDAGFHWVLPMGATYYSGDSSTSSIIVKFDSLRFQDVMLTASDYNGKCATIDTKRIKVVYQPTADAYIKEDICAGDTIVLALSGRSDNADHFTWSFDGASIVTANSNTGGPYKVFWPTAGAKVVTIQPFSMEGCKGEITLDTVKVHEIPDAVIAGIETRGTGTLCLEDSVMLKARTEKQEWNYTWTPAHFFNASNKGHIWGKIETRGYVILTVKDAFGCVGADSLLLNPESCCTVKFPTAFSPNNDGKNDAFRPVFDGYHRFHAFRVMNRWGQTVFESTNSKMEWDGTFNGTPQDLGVYYYYIKFDCEDGKGSKEHEQSGEVTLLR